MEPTISFTVTRRNAEGKNTRRVSHPRKETKISVRGGAERAKGKAPGAYRTHFTHVVLLHPIYGSFDRPYRVANNPRARAIRTAVRKSRLLQTWKLTHASNFYDLLAARESLLTYPYNQIAIIKSFAGINSVNAIEPRYARLFELIKNL